MVGITTIAEAKKAMQELVADISHVEPFTREDDLIHRWRFIEILEELEKSVRDKRDEAKKSAPKDGYYTQGIKDAVTVVVCLRFLVLIEQKEPTTITFTIYNGN